MIPRVLLVLAAAAAMPQVGALTAEERALTTFIDANNDSALAFLERGHGIGGLHGHHFFLRMMEVPGS